jgi:tetratricopeptide (TPR) repeat protein
MRRRWPVWEHNEMGTFFYSREAYDLAIAEFKRALKAAPIPIPALHVNLGAAYLGKKMYAEACASFRRALALDPNNPKAHWFLARALKEAGTLSEALVAFERAYTLNPESPEGRSAGEEVRQLRATLGVQQ